MGHYAQCLYAECRDYLNVMVRVVMLSVVMLNVHNKQVFVPGSFRVGKTRNLT